MLRNGADVSVYGIGGSRADKLPQVASHACPPRASREEEGTFMDINKATPEELEKAFQVDGIRAGYIIERRDKQGPFRSWEEVKQVPGFEDRMVENLRAAGLTLGSGQGESNRKQEGQDQSRSRNAGGLDINSASAEELQR